ncbi:MAG: cysteine hydrolase [Pseudomonadales bacterium]|nr:cysteine hydrolase [Pseudomonadales bacterium]NRA17992.1 cysteine hydrolase [Oceanospirillaceae bacterium]
MKQKVLLIIDLQNDYFPGGNFPLWNTEQILNNVQLAIVKANQQNIPVIHTQHIADEKMGIAPFFNQGTVGADIHQSILTAAADAPVVVKAFADAFEDTNLQQLLQSLKCDELLICGMMTQNCVTHTAISKAAENYQVSILTDCCTTTDEMIHNIALHGVSTRVPLVTAQQALG